MEVDVVVPVVEIRRRPEHAVQIHVDRRAAASQRPVNEFHFLGAQIVVESVEGTNVVTATGLALFIGIPLPTVFAMVLGEVQEACAGILVDPQAGTFRGTGS